MRIRGMLSFKTMTITINTSDSVVFNLNQRAFSALKPTSQGIVTGILFSESSFEYRVEWEDQVVRWHFAKLLSAEKCVE